MAVLSKLIYRSMQSLSKPQQAFLKNWQVGPEISREMQRIQNSQNNYENAEHFLISNLLQIYSIQDSVVLT